MNVYFKLSLLSLACAGNVYIATRATAQAATAQPATIAQTNATQPVRAALATSQDQRFILKNPNDYEEGEWRMIRARNFATIRSYKKALKAHNALKAEGKLAADAAAPAVEWEG